ncbi:hypothetical protein HAX54_000792, partial [Datura stramonium]|nr:hypothetical protein [Datura stramonium]
QQCEAPASQHNQPHDAATTMAYCQAQGAFILTLYTTRHGSNMRAMAGPMQPFLLRIGRCNTNQLLRVRRGDTAVERHFGMGDAITSTPARRGSSNGILSSARRLHPGAIHHAMQPFLLRVGRADVTVERRCGMVNAMIEWSECKEGKNDVAREEGCQHRPVGSALGVVPCRECACEDMPRHDACTSKPSHSRKPTR